MINPHPCGTRGCRYDSVVGGEDRGPLRGTEQARAKHVLLIDDDLDLAPLVQTILEEEGCRVSVLPDIAAESVRDAVNRLEPDCILLDGAGQGDFGASWLAAAAISERARPIPVIMFSVDARATGEAQAGTSARTLRADFAAVLPKPFELETLLATVAAVLNGSA